MPAALVKEIGFLDSQAFSLTYPITVPAGGVAAGNRILVLVDAVVGSDIVTGVTDTAGNSYARDLSLISAADVRSIYFYSANAAGSLSSGNSITIAVNDDNRFINAIAAEFSGVATSSALDKTSTAETAFGTAHSSGLTAMTSQANELLVGGHAMGNGDTWTPDSGWSVIRNVPGATSGRRTVLQYQIVAVAGTYASSGTTSANAETESMIATYRASSGDADNQIAWIRA